MTSLSPASRVAYRGVGHVLGFGEDYFGIWADGRDEPIRRFPRTDEGWAEAWTTFRVLEPNAERVTGGDDALKDDGVGLPPGDAGAVLAGPGRRFVARLMDALLLGCFVVIALLVTGRYPTSQVTVAAALPGVWWLLAVGMIYEVSLTATRGQTLGKKAMRIRVAALPDGGPPGFARAFARWVLPVFMNVVPGLGLIAYAWILVDPLRQGLHDKAAGTVVVANGGVESEAVR